MEIRAIFIDQAGGPKNLEMADDHNAGRVGGQIEVNSGGGKSVTAWGHCFVTARNTVGIFFFLYRDWLKSVYQVW